VLILPEIKIFLQMKKIPSGYFVECEKCIQYMSEGLKPPRAILKKKNKVG
jgi:hypothetical protein